MHVWPRRQEPAGAVRALAAARQVQVKMGVHARVAAQARTCRRSTSAGSRAPSTRRTWTRPWTTSRSSRSPAAAPPRRAPAVTFLSAVACLCLPCDQGSEGEALSGPSCPGVQRGKFRPRQQKGRKFPVSDQEQAVYKGVLPCAVAQLLTLRARVRRTSACCSTTTGTACRGRRPTARSGSSTSPTRSTSPCPSTTCRCAAPSCLSFLGCQTLSSRHLVIPYSLASFDSPALGRNSNNIEMLCFIIFACWV